ncbi:MAG TPA: hypothetical protein VGK39_05820, partial [Cyclobacteriaceae bacterium]
GAELEFRKSILNISKTNASTIVDFGLSVSYLYSHQPLEDVDFDDISFANTNPESALEGASPWLVNSDITLTREGGRGNKLTATVLFNFNTDRIYSLGAPGDGKGVGNFDIDEKSILKMDFISSYVLNNHFTIGLSVKNILNPHFKQTKEVTPTPGTTAFETISDYQKGITTSIGVAYKL